MQLILKVRKIEEQRRKWQENKLFTAHEQHLKVKKQENNLGRLRRRKMHLSLQLIHLVSVEGGLHCAEEGV